ncbi:SUMO1 sentrin specific peptidase 8 [Dipsacomyces acuminosporus]|nr:SUMO1 sentrin specific peptidase 8 [Dipsacomyces acuminosporus]
MTSRTSSTNLYQCRDFPMTLSRDDIDALRPGEWVTDDVIDFYFRYLKCKNFPSDRRYVYIPVNIANLLTERAVESSKEHLKELASDANALDFETQCLKKPRHIKVAFLPIFGDGHWSLLVYRYHKHKPQEFLHFNSYLNSTREMHTQCARNALINLLYVFRENDPEMSIAKESYQLVIKNCPQQNNGNDCGVFVCMYAYILTSRLVKQAPEAGPKAIHSLVKRLTLLPGSSAHRSDEVRFSAKDRNKDQRPDDEEQQWKIKDKDALLPDDMRAYITKVIYHTTYTRSSASL